MQSVTGQTVTQTPGHTSTQSHIPRKHPHHRRRRRQFDRTALTGAPSQQGESASQHLTVHRRVNTWHCKENNPFAERSFNDSRWQQRGANRVALERLCAGLGAVVGAGSCCIGYKTITAAASFQSNRASTTKTHASDPAKDRKTAAPTSDTVQRQAPTTSLPRQTYCHKPDRTKTYGQWDGQWAPLGGALVTIISGGRTTADGGRRTEGGGNTLPRDIDVRSIH